MNHRRIEFYVGSFVLVGLIAVAYLAIQIGSNRSFRGQSYQVQAKFDNVGGVNPGSRVEIAGVPVGTVKDIRLDENFYVLVTLELPKSLKLDEDTIASVKTAGLIGDRFIELAPGGFGELLEDGDIIVNTESAIDLESLIRRFAFGTIDKAEE